MQYKYLYLNNIHLSKIYIRFNSNNLNMAIYKLCKILDLNNIHTHNFCKLTMNYNLCKVVHMEYMNQCLNKIQICNLCKYYLMYKFYMDLYKDYILNLKQQNNNRLYKKYKLLEYYMSSKDVHNFKENITNL